MTKGTGRIGVDVRSYPHMIEARLFGFGIDSAALHSEHCSWLDKHVLPVLAGGGSVHLIGEASRSGSAAHNDALSKRRSSAVLAYLRRKARRHVPYKLSSSYLGEFGAEHRGQKDGTENSFERAVVVTVWPRPTPPPKSKPRRP